MPRYEQETGRLAARRRSCREHVAALDAALQDRLRGPDGTDVRRAHLCELIADQLFGGDHAKARRLMALPNVLIDGRTIGEAARTHEDMLVAKALIEDLRSAGFGEVQLEIAESVQHQLRQEDTLLLDLLQAAWDMSDAEFEELMCCHRGWLRAFRNHEAGIGPKLLRRLKRLRRFHNALRLTTHPQRYRTFWRRPWSRQSPIGARSPWSAYQRKGDSALDLMEVFLLAAL